MLIYLICLPIAIFGGWYTVRIILRSKQKKLRLLNLYQAILLLSIFLSWLFGNLGLLTRNNYSFFLAQLSTEVTAYCLATWILLNSRPVNSPKNKKLILRPGIAVIWFLVSIFRLFSYIQAGAALNHINIADNAELVQSKWLTVGVVIGILFFFLCNTLHLLGCWRIAQSSDAPEIKYRYFTNTADSFGAFSYFVGYMVEILGYSYQLQDLARIGFQIRLLAILLVLPLAMMLIFKKTDRVILSRYIKLYEKSMIKRGQQLGPFFEEVAKQFPYSLQFQPHSLQDVADKGAISLTAMTTRMNDVRRIIFRAEAWRKATLTGTAVDKLNPINKISMDEEAKFWVMNISSNSYAEETRRLNNCSFNPTNAVPPINEANRETVVIHYVKLAKRVKKMMLKQQKGRIFSVYKA